MAKKQAVVVAVKRKRVRRYEFDNARVVLTGANAVDCIPTPDKCDRAHSVRDGAGWLVPGYLVKNATPRRYHPSQLTSRGVPFDSSFDPWHKLQRKYRAAGINLGGGAMRFVGASSDERYRLAAELGGARALRDRLHQRTKCEMTEQERQLEIAATLLLVSRKQA